MKAFSAMLVGAAALAATAAAIADPTTPPANPAAVPAASAASVAMKADVEAVIGNPGDEDAFERVLARLPKVTLDDGGVPRTFYLWEGDLLLERSDVLFALLTARPQQQPARGAEELLVKLDALGRPTYWAATARSLTFAVDCAGFPSPAHCKTASDAAEVAAKDWEKACANCRLTFRKVAMPAPGQPAPTFILRYQPANLGYIAIAFFPNDPPYRRVVFVAPSYFTTSFDKVGVLRHEFGHVLGYRHEHIQGIAGCSYEGTDWKPLTPYDPKSVMHYPCGGGGSQKMALSTSDVAGHRRQYALP